MKIGLIKNAERKIYGFPKYYNLSYEELVNSFQKLKLARLSKLEDIDLLSWAEKLMKAIGKLCKKDNYNFDNEKEYLQELIASLEKESKTPKK